MYVEFSYLFVCVFFFCFFLGGEYGIYKYSVYVVIIPAV